MIDFDAKADEVRARGFSWAAKYGPPEPTASAGDTGGDADENADGSEAFLLTLDEVRIVEAAAGPPSSPADRAARAALFASLVSRLREPDVQASIVTALDDVLADAEAHKDAAAIGAAADGADDVHMLLGSTNLYIVRTAASVLARLVLANDEPNKLAISLINWIRTQLRDRAENTVMPVALATLMRLLRNDAFRVLYAAEDGIDVLASLLRVHDNVPQILYMVCFCMWMLTYNAQLADGRANDVIPALMPLLKRAVKEKITRLVLASLRNLVNKGTNNEQMVVFGLPKVIQAFGERKWADEDITEDVKALAEVMESDVAQLGSFDMYKQQLLNGELEWTTLHRDEAFWRENVTRFDANNYQLVRVLVNTVATSSNSVHLAVACYDLGEFVRYHPRGKRILEDLKAKTHLMQLMAHSELSVQKEALLATQKLLINNWAFVEET